MNFGILWAYGPWRPMGRLLNFYRKNEQADMAISALMESCMTILHFIQKVAINVCIYLRS